MRNKLWLNQMIATKEIELGARRSIGHKINAAAEGCATIVKLSDAEDEGLKEDHRRL